MQKAMAGIVTLVFFCTGALASGASPIKPSGGDKCPVCGMFVFKYPDFIAEIIFKDSSYVVFDGAKDMFKYYLNMSKYSPGKNLSDIDSLYVTDYYDLKMIDGFKAFFVEGSDVYGPMGKELIPFEKESDAKEFMVDHTGNALYRFENISPDLIKRLD